MLTAWTDLDLFEVWRRILGITCTVYALVVMTQSLLRWLRYLQETATASGGSHAGTSSRGSWACGSRRWWPDLLHIAGLILMLAGLLYAHKWVWPHAG